MNGATPTKRAKVSATLAPAPASASATTATVAAAAAVTGELALLQNIISFIPSSPTEKNGAASATSQPALVLKTIAALCRAIPGLSRLVGPTNEAFWREMVLAHFDFETSDYVFNVEDWGGDWYNNRNVVDDECDDPEYADWHRHPANGPHREWMRDHPEDSEASAEPGVVAEPDVRDSNADPEDGDEGEESNGSDESEEEDCYGPSEFLVDGLECWSTLGAYFKPAAYGFLEEIQNDRSELEALWPDHEDAFSLFCDLLLLPSFQSTDKYEWETCSDGQQPVYPCLLGQLPTKIVGRGFAMLKFCDFAPYFWTGVKEPVSKRWSGFDEAFPPFECKWRTKKRAEREAAARKRLERGRNHDEADDEEESDFDMEEDEADGYRDVDHDDCEKRTREERSLFPRSPANYAHPFLHLRRFVYTTFSDWRLVHLNQGEMASPRFYIGSTKRSGRWMGFVGQSDYA